MTCKIEQSKKEYSAPKMEVVELRLEVNLLQNSKFCPQPFYCDEGA